MCFGTFFGLHPCPIFWEGGCPLRGNCFKIIFPKTDATFQSCFLPKTLLLHPFHLVASSISPCCFIHFTLLLHPFHLVASSISPCCFIHFTLLLHPFHLVASSTLDENSAPSSARISTLHQVPRCPGARLSKTTLDNFKLRCVLPSKQLRLKQLALPKRTWLASSKRENKDMGKNAQKLPDFFQMSPEKEPFQKEQNCFSNFPTRIFWGNMLASGMVGLAVVSFNRFITSNG